MFRSLFKLFVKESNERFMDENNFGLSSKPACPLFGCYKLFSIFTYAKGLRMKLSSALTDNITEILSKIIKFTCLRRKILLDNISNVHSYDFMPKDLDVDDFSEVLSCAISEYVLNHRLVLCDTDNIKFGVNGDFQVNPQNDIYARELLVSNKDQYLELQLNKLMENSINLKVAGQLLKQRQMTASV